MSTPAPQDPFELARTLDADNIRARMYALDAERTTLSALLRAATARDKAEKRRREIAAAAAGKRGGGNAS
jgi:hypothetical protein